ncbi:hypothetical protein LMH87_010558 [Akanthomyces muscarius]|uniref:Uncharacterized protein n=1 Tax=Akanthomyces muscarius TaxID=2231603 RepID=A0A9W8QEF7_AKAMU|nr:hypothetical protein LMH87_010558 [Akanthomyces muscarius]KAJ4154095.1 hypothetical protein LMH87_010558 [Akanthomyces muscarius]
MRENTLTPPQSPRSSRARTPNTFFMKKATLLSATEPPLGEIEQQPNSKSCDNDKVGSQALHLVPEAATGSAFTAGDNVKTLVAGNGIKDASDGIRTHPLELDGRSSPSNSFFDDAFFVNDEQKDDEDIEMQSIALILDRIDNLLIPLPILSTSGPNHITPDELSMLSTLNWEYQRQLPPLNIDATMEAALSWTPLPPRRGGQFGEEALEEPSKHPTTNALETTPMLIGIIGNIEDVEVEECAETKEATKPQPPLKNSLDSLVRLRLQRRASERAPPSSSHTLPPQPKTPTPILPSANDPGATSKLVSAFMTLRGVKKRRAAPRS